jgi:hypothetical protein
MEKQHHVSMRHPVIKTDVCNVIHDKQYIPYVKTYKSNKYNQERGQNYGHQHAHDSEYQYEYFVPGGVNRNSFTDKSINKKINKQHNESKQYVYETKVARRAKVVRFSTNNEEENFFSCNESVSE